MDDPENENSLWDYSIEMGLCELEVEELKKNGVSPSTHLGNLDERLDAQSDEANSWIETIYSMKESPAAKMKIFLEHQARGVTGIRFVEGVQGDGNLHYATADNLEAVKRLEETLTNMGRTVEVVTVKI